MRKLIIKRFHDNVELPSQYQNTLLVWCTILMHVKIPSQSSSHALSIMSTTIPVTTVNWSDLCHIILPSSYKVTSLESADKQHSLWTFYKSLYPEQATVNNYLAETFKTYLSVTVGNQLYGSMSERHSLHWARIYASICTVAGWDELNLD